MTDFETQDLLRAAVNIGDFRGHDIDTQQSEIIERYGYSAIKISKDHNHKVTYAFVTKLNYTISADQPNIDAYGITLSPESINKPDEVRALSLLDAFFNLVNRSEFQCGSWDVTVRNVWEKPSVSMSHPMLRWGFHAEVKDSSISSVAGFLPVLSDFLDQISKEFGEFNPEAWEVLDYNIFDEPAPINDEGQGQSSNSEPADFEPDDDMPF